MTCVKVNTGIIDKKFSRNIINRHLTLVQNTISSFSRCARTYPKVEHIIGGLPPVKRETTEKNVKKETAKEPKIQKSAIDVNHLANQIYTLLEKRIWIEKERRRLS